MCKFKFVNFIGRIIKTYKVFPIHNPEISTEPSVGVTDSRLVDFFLNTTKLTFVYFKRALPHKDR